MRKIETDIVIIGGGVAGCITSLLYAKENFKVALLERKSVEEYNRKCTHYIQPIATKVIKRLDLEEEIQEAGGLKNRQDIWTPSGWVRYAEAYKDDDEKPYGFNITRKALDPFLRRKIAKEENIDLYTNCMMKSIIFNDNNKAIGVKAINNQNNEELEISAKLIVAADGRFSKIANMIDNKAEEKPNHRFSLTAYFNDVPLKTAPTSQTWMIELGQAHAFHLSNNTTLLNVFLELDVLDEWKNSENLEEKFLKFFSELDDGPDLSNYKRATEFTWMLKMTNKYRTPAKNGIAFVGDAAMAVDPMSGAGCAFAMAAAEVLVDSTNTALQGESDMEEALESYSANHIGLFKSHADGIATYSVSNKGKSDEQFFDMVVNDKTLSKHYLNLIGRLVTPKEFQVHFFQGMIDKQKRMLANANTNS